MVLSDSTFVKTKDLTLKIQNLTFPHGIDVIFGGNAAAYLLGQKKLSRHGLLHYHLSLYLLVAILFFAKLTVIVSAFGKF